MKKICFVIPRTYYLFNLEIKKNIVPGGAQVQVYYLSTALAEDINFDVHFVVADFGQPNFELKKNVKLHKSFSFSDNLFKRIYKLFETLKKTDADTYIFRSADIGAALTILYVRKILKKKVLYMLASDVETSKKRQKKHSGALKTFAMQYVYKNADIITVQTDEQKKLFEKYRNRKINSVIKNIYLRKKNAQINFEEKNTILWVGRLTEIKKPEIFLTAAKKYPDEKFIMIAPLAIDKKEYGIAIKNKAKKIKNLKLLEYVKPTEIFEYYKKAKIYILSSELEGFSNTMAEAMAANCPILSYNVNPDNILHKFNFGFCVEKNTNKFWASFEKLRENSDLRKKMGENGSKYIKDFHQKEQIINIFKTLL